MRKIYFIFILGFLLLATPCSAEIYQYVDDQGKRWFVDRLDAIPSRYRKKIIEKKEAKIKPENSRQAQIQRVQTSKQKKRERKAAMKKRLEKKSKESPAVKRAKQTIKSASRSSSKKKKSESKSKGSRKGSHR